MDSLRGTRKVLPNYLLDDYVPAPDTRPSSDRASGTSLSHPPSAGESSRHGSDTAAGFANAASSAGDLSDTSAGALGFLPRRKKKLRQACVYCRRSHLVCEEKRPCHRCVKRGIADRCVDPPQDAQLLPETSWPGAAETSADADSTDDASIPLTSALASTLPGSDGGQKRKRKTKSEAHRSSSAESHRQYGLAAPHSDQHSSRDSFAESHTASTYAQPANYGPHHADPATNVQASSLSNAIPAPSISHDASIPNSLGMQSEPLAARGAPSQLLQGQPIFQPPSSAELDSLFSTYFFDVADAFSGRENGVQHQGMPPPHAAAQGSALHAHQQVIHAPASQRHDGLRNAGATPLQAPQMGHLIPAGASPRYFRSPNEVGFPPHHQGRQSDASTHAQRNPPTSASTDGEAATSSNLAVLSAPTAARHGANERETKPPSSTDSHDSPGRQRPGDVYAPYPYRKGYASLMRYMTEQNWSEQSIRSVEAALCKIRRLWFSLEDNIQPSSMIQLQAEWAGNVRYFSESVLPFTPIPMLVCRKAGEVYASNQLAQDLCGRTRQDMTGGRLSCYELMTESSASGFFRLYGLAVGGHQAEDGTYIPSVGNTTPLYWNAEILRPNADGSSTVVPTRGIFEMKIAPCGLPSVLVCCFVPLS
ncbi:potential fungal zinc cluster transcription factor [Pseudozyma hubeiensis SY62]|uniref:Potential fungal zinc cluster transcription factor n=1 Tax=Pseudozyma hubeiensis (strain SY62) TaxID=1305764 RepID=R9P0S8_PSEHS|nr:potential fungal zinc cluster transcription factor [Pseudozyma hubeiensis SY62]GAC94682.1 potential fungal zinc cluster transcription factor [Pseudozyma hubeiensis SY62]